MNGTRYQRNPEAFSRTLPSGEAVILHPDSDEYLGLNEVGAVIWAQLDRPTTLEALISVVAEAFPDASESARHDVERFVDDLNQRNLTRAVQPTS